MKFRFWNYQKKMKLVLPCTQISAMKYHCFKHWLMFNEKTKSDQALTMTLFEGTMNVRHFLRKNYDNYTY